MCSEYYSCLQLLLVNSLADSVICCESFSNAALQIEIENGNQENQKLLKDIDILKTTLLSTIIIEDDQW